MASKPKRKSAAKPKRKRAAVFSKATAERAALASGRKQAAAALEVRSAIREQRRRAVIKHYRALHRRAMPKDSRAKALPASAIPADVGIIVAEGDSWFDYPFYDVLKLLDDEFGYRIESGAHRGDAVESMAYAGGQLQGIVKLLDRLAQDGQVPKAILLSGGGNDIAGPAFGILLNHKDSPIAGLNATVLEGVIDQRIRTAYIQILSIVTSVSKQLWPKQPAIPILVHGYDYPVPDGRGFLGGWGPLPGPWLEPGFRQKNYADLQERIAIAATLIERFNAMLQSITAMAAFRHVSYVDLRNTLSTRPADYRKWWGNELHPTKDGFIKVTQRFVEVLRR
ncbi:MAG: SGNH/GDSL hydrolase family protein [Burkholderiales bacterium]